MFACSLSRECLHCNIRILMVNKKLRVLLRAKDEPLDDEIGAQEFGF